MLYCIVFCHVCDLMPLFSYQENSAKHQLFFDVFCLLIWSWPSVAA